MINDYFSSPLSLNFGTDHLSHTDFAFGLAVLDPEISEQRAGLDNFYGHFYGYDERYNIFR
ncbi:MAG: hypothetical protein J6C23_03040 [Clostridia bacterium]|nr:hypothetical protein [Clostridia bacterium]